MMAKQSGPHRRVKAGARLGLAGFLTALALTSCTGFGPQWHQAGHSAKETDRDLANCEKSSERDTLAGMGRSRGSYGMETAPRVGGGNQNPMEMHDHAETADRFHDAVARCMTGLGYETGHAADHPSRR